MKDSPKDTREIPQEIWKDIFSQFLPFYPYFGMVAQVSKQWQSIIQKIAPTFAQPAISLYFPYLQSKKEYQSNPLRLFAEAYQKYQKMVPNLAMEAVLAALSGNKETILAEPDENKRKQLLGLAISNKHSFDDDIEAPFERNDILREGLQYAKAAGNIEEAFFIAYLLMSSVNVAAVSDNFELLKTSPLLPKLKQEYQEYEQEYNTLLSAYTQSYTQSPKDEEEVEVMAEEDLKTNLGHRHIG